MRGFRAKKGVYVQGEEFIFTAKSVSAMGKNREPTEEKGNTLMFDIQRRARAICLGLWGKGGVCPCLQCKGGIACTQSQRLERVITVIRKEQFSHRSGDR